jgi:glycosyl transferase family 7 (putative galactosyltransferase)/methyltransferase family protein
MTISLLVPYRAGDANRDRVWAWLASRWREALPDAELLTGDDGRMPFSRAAALNRAADQASGDVYVILDGDTWFEPEAIESSAAQIRRGRIGWLHKARKHFLDELATQRVVDGEMSLEDAAARAPFDEYVIPAPMVLSRAAFEAVNGFDERFRGWGCEDNAFVLALTVLVHPAAKKGAGTAVHMWHPSRHIGRWQVWDGQHVARPGLNHLRRYHRAHRGTGMAELVAGNRDSRKRRFSEIWARNAWQGSESRSGPGSNSGTRAQLGDVLESYEWRSILDIGCGEAIWQPELPGYVGLDIVPEALDVARRRHPGWRFICADAVTDRLPQTEAVLVRDVLPHLSLEDGQAVIANIRRAGARYLMATTFRDGRNTGVGESGHYRPDMTSPPFDLGRPIALVPDGHHPGYEVPEKMLGVWQL